MHRVGIVIHHFGTELSGMREMCLDQVEFCSHQSSCIKPLRFSLSMNLMNPPSEVTRLEIRFLSPLPKFLCFSSSGTPRKPSRSHITHLPCMPLCAVPKLSSFCIHSNFMACCGHMNDICFSGAYAMTFNQSFAPTCLASATTDKTDMSLNSSFPVMRQA